MSTHSSRTQRVHSIFKRGGSLKGRAAVLAAVTAITIAIVISAIDLSGGARAARAATGTLYFGNGTAKLVGKTALVPVKCVGVEGSECTGKLSVKADGSTFEAPYAIAGGGDREISIPLSGVDAGTSVVATAKTEQLSGRYATSTEVLRLR